MQEAFDFYKSILESVCVQGLISTKDAVLVVAAGEFDKQVLTAAGFSDVTISNLDSRMHAKSFEPFKWSFEDAERLSYADESFDFAVVHSGLHHCRVPHQALAEMYRVSRKGVLFIESRDNFLMRAAARMGLAVDYEIEAVVANSFAFGGVRNSATPNYVYRWTEREVVKTANSMDPSGPLNLQFFYSFRLPTSRLQMHRSLMVRSAGKLLSGPAKIMASLFRKQGNLFAAFIGRPSETWPWNNSDGTINRSWALTRYAAPEGSQQR